MLVSTGIQEVLGALPGFVPSVDTFDLFIRAHLSSARGAATGDRAHLPCLRGPSIFVQCYPHVTPRSISTGGLTIHVRILQDPIEDPLEGGRDGYGTPLLPTLKEALRRSKNSLNRGPPGIDARGTSKSNKQGRAAEKGKELKDPDLELRGTRGEERVAAGQLELREDEEGKIGDYGTTGQGGAGDGDGAEERDRYGGDGIGESEGWEEMTPPLTALHHRVAIAALRANNAPR
ncbi:hypothetical protein DXG01_008128 [Tephrocybe rancida]|nr:hypothetical protein DXG01_008128 [Tephrocybe rancida]